MHLIINISTKNEIAKCKGRQQSPKITKRNYGAHSNFLPTLDAIRTMCIRQFGNLWALLLSLEFDDFNFYLPMDQTRRQAVMVLGKRTSFRVYHTIITNQVYLIVILYDTRVFHVTVGVGTQPTRYEQKYPTI